MRFIYDGRYALNELKCGRCGGRDAVGEMRSGYQVRDVHWDYCAGELRWESYAGLVLTCSA